MNCQTLYYKTVIFHILNSIYKSIKYLVIMRVSVYITNDIDWPMIFFNVWTKAHNNTIKIMCRPPIAKPYVVCGRKLFPLKWK